ncbi:hypothetical protein B0H16DRAFT_1542679 [Mycena metata]|uniref:Uncharacterized protein n=1 Tax=Mycena metata TaxID=1033252 RepID=A0AAD7J3V4_9AGAR|nr:hypothetical protein B0H16DRAFT_1542679 [Mycena metata]
MAVTALESQRRKSVVLLETRPCNPPPLPPPPYIPNPVLDSSGNGKASKGCIKSRPASPVTRRQRHAAADRAFLNLRQGVFVPPLFSRNSRFPSRHLPPPGLRACNLDATDAKVFVPGDEVRVRRLNIDSHRSSWSEWQTGRVLQYVPMRVYIGNFGHAYCVQVEREGRLTEEEYVQFMGEICPKDEFDHEGDALTSEECKKRRHKANYIYTRIPSDKPISGIPQRDVWTPAEVLVWGVHRKIHVRSLAGPTAGELIFVEEALPYTLETAVACRKHNQNVVGPNGRLFLTDKRAEPLVIDDDPPRPLYDPPFVVELTPTPAKPLLLRPSP